jgi:hypothetical protein
MLRWEEKPDDACGEDSSQKEHGGLLQQVAAEQRENDSSSGANRNQVEEEIDKCEETLNHGFFLLVPLLADLSTSALPNASDNRDLALLNLLLNVAIVIPSSLAQFLIES